MKGDIIILNRTGYSDTIASSIQRFFTRKPFTHVTIDVGNILGKQSVLSAEELSIIRPFDDYYHELDTEIYVYQLNNINKIGINTAINELYDDVIGNYYGVFQVLWFVWRWFNEVFLHRDMKSKDNPIRNGIICSELVFMYLKKIQGHVPGLTECLNEYRTNNVHVGDIHDILCKFPETFRLTHKIKNKREF